MKILHLIVAFLDGKKAIIQAIEAPILTYLTAGNLISANLAALIQSSISGLIAWALYIETTDAYKQSSAAI